jgi:FKBP-type peptidyl-prolyl cis-trans isomerase SlyD
VSIRKAISTMSWRIVWTAVVFCSLSTFSLQAEQKSSGDTSQSAKDNPTITETPKQHDKSNKNKKAVDASQKNLIRVADKTVVAFHYTLSTDAGEVIDSSSAREPLVYLHGAGNIVPGLEKQMINRKAGDKFNAVVKAEDGYGLHDPLLVQQVPRQSFADVEQLEVGMQFEAQTEQGPLSAVVTKIDGDTVTVDANHPLAGQNLNYAIEVVDVRKASAEESSHGHVHGAGGHQHNN